MSIYTFQITVRYLVLSVFVFSMKSQWAKYFRIKRTLKGTRATTKRPSRSIVILIFFVLGLKLQDRGKKTAGN